MGKAGIEASLHSLRHMHASVLLSSGLSLIETSKRLGHASPNVTLSTYAHRIKKDEDKAIEVWDAETAEIINKTAQSHRKPNGSALMDVRICEGKKAKTAGSV